MNKTKTIISLFDIHLPFNINLSPVYKFIKEIKPDEIILGGDQIDLFGISKYYDGDPEKGMFEAAKEVRQFEDILKMIKKLSPKTKLVRLDGNHEDRVWEFVAGNPDRAEILNMHQIYKPYISTFVKYNDFYKTGKLYRTHGIYHNDNHSKKHAMNVGKSVIYGHMHEIQSYSSKTLVGEKPHIAKSRPCLSILNPDYKRNLPSGRTNGFGITYIRPDGCFDDYTIVITDGKFIYGGKTYE